METQNATRGLALPIPLCLDQALLDLAQRTGLPEIRSLTTMLIQTERFGTSIAHSLRVHAESMRTKRRQRAEEAAAKTTIKMIFPLALCIFPALFVVILGPALINITEALGEVTLLYFEPQHGGDPAIAKLPGMEICHLWNLQQPCFFFP